MFRRRCSPHGAAQHQRPLAPSGCKLCMPSRAQRSWGSSISRTLIPRWPPWCRHRQYQHCPVTSPQINSAGSRRHNVPISPGYTFGPVVEEMLQQSPQVRELLKQLTELLPRPAYAQRQGQHQWKPRAAALQTIVCIVPVAAPPAPGRQYPNNRLSAATGSAKQRFIARPCALGLKIQANGPQKAQPNAILEKVFTAITKASDLAGHTPCAVTIFVNHPDEKRLEGLSKQLDWDVRTIQRWFRQRRNQEKPSTLSKFCESMFIARPCALGLKIQANGPQKAQPNAILEKHPDEKRLEGLSKQLDWDVRTIQRWFRQRRNQEKPSTLSKFCESMFIARPCALGLKIQANGPQKAQPNAILEKVFTAITKASDLAGHTPCAVTIFVNHPDEKRLEGLSKQLDWDVRTIQRWFRQRRNQEKPSTLSKFCESMADLEISYAKGLQKLASKLNKASSSMAKKNLGSAFQQEAIQPIRQVLEEHTKKKKPAKKKLFGTTKEHEALFNFVENNKNISTEKEKQKCHRQMDQAVREVDVEKDIQMLVEETSVPSQESKAEFLLADYFEL
ncbi:UNVERIFIED_CONTAM: hypothetical protein FKN15_025245 [Acipenser sinensis]